MNHSNETFAPSEKTKKALVTGASEGIGRSLCLLLAQQGYEVTAIARNEKRLTSLLQEMNLDKHHKYLVADLTKGEDLKRVLTEVESNTYQLLVNNAGFGQYGLFHQLGIDEQMEIIHLNVNSLVRISHSFLSKAQSGDALVNISSVLALLPMPQAAIYSATKSFVTSFSESLWYENQKRGIYVMGFCPGVTQTNFHERAGGQASNHPPQYLVQTSDAVAKNIWRALQKRKEPTVISGTKNWMMSQIPRFIPRKTTVDIMGQQRR